MKNKQKRLIFFLSLAIIFLLSGCSGSNSSKNVNKASARPTQLKPVFKDDPTLYFHGLMGSVKNEKPLVDAAKNTGVTNSVIRANVDETGKVKLVGTLTSKAKNPIVKVNFADNMQSNFKRAGTYASNVVKALQKKYHIQKVNMIGYSLGNMAIIHYVLENGNNPKMPRLHKMVNLAGHFDGAYFKELPAEFRSPSNLKLDQNGKPNKMNETYRQMTKVRPIFAKHPVAALNIIGDIGNGGDGVVEIASARSLKYLVGKKNYQELIVNTDHGSLPSNQEAIDAAIKFLWK